MIRKKKPYLVEKVELSEGVEVQWVGVYALKWRPEWGYPTVGFREVIEANVNDDPSVPAG